MPPTRSLLPSTDGEDRTRPESDRHIPAEKALPSQADNADPVAPRPENIDRAASRGHLGFSELPGSGLHMPPEMLGMISAETPSKDSTNNNNGSSTGKTRWANVRPRKAGKREKAIKSLESPATVAAAAGSATTPEQCVQQVDLQSTLFTLVTYGGVDIIFALTPDMSVLGICSRTHYLLQKICLASDSPVVSITSNSSSGLLIIAHSDGIVKTYRPVPTNGGEPRSTKSPKYPADLPHAFGFFFWVDSVIIEAAKTFYQSEEEAYFSGRGTGEPGSLIDISSSSDKLLIAHKNQLAVFEAFHKVDKKKSTDEPLDTRRLLWTTLLPSGIVTAKISGDGQAIVVVIEGDEDDDGSFGARTFIRDVEDGGINSLTNTTKSPRERSSSMGMVFKTGPFLKHASPVTRISFRGQGRSTSSSTSYASVGNDLLLTFCKADSYIRIYNQNGWKQLMNWAAAPETRAEWIRGSTALSLGDLESPQKTRATGSRVPSRRPSGSSDPPAGPGTSTGIRDATPLGGASPTTAAGAWIAEITFRDAFPALRLSRLSYMKRGNDDSQPAHFESISAILPAGSVVPGSVLNADDMGFSVQGIWPAWSPWLSESNGSQNNETTNGSAMQLLGLSSVPPPHTHYFGDSYLGGTHSPPTELRITASHPTSGSLVVMEFPLWGDEDFGAMELGSPFRSILSLSGILPLARKDSSEQPLPNDSIKYDSTSRLDAQIDSSQKSISLHWRQQGSCSVFSPDLVESDLLVHLDSGERKTPQLMEDMSIIPAPLALPSVCLPSGMLPSDEDCIIAVKWWADQNFDGPPLLLAVTRSSTLVVFEVPPPCSVREPAMPNFDSLNTSSHGTVDDFYGDGGSESEGEDDSGDYRQEYEVAVTPHPDFGLGLRLESPMDGMPAVAGSFKKHPLNGGVLPAEKTGMIVLGDEVLSVNGVSLEHLTFDDIIATVRHVGAKCGPGQPLLLRFRPSGAERGSRNSAIVQASFSACPVASNDTSTSDTAVNRRSIMGVGPKPQRNRVVGHQRDHSGEGSLTSMPVDRCESSQLDFGRVIGVVREALPMQGGAIGSCSESMVVLPWGEGLGSHTPTAVKDAALIICADARTVFAKRLELPDHRDAEKVHLAEVGAVNLEGTNEKKESSSAISSIRFIPFNGKDRYFAVADSHGQITLLAIEIVKSNDDEESIAWTADFRRHKIIDIGPKASLRCGSVGLFASYSRQGSTGHQATVTVWEARCDPSCRRMTAETAIKDEYFGQHYITNELEVTSSDSSSVDIVDVLFLRTGYLASAPLIVVLTPYEALVHQRLTGQARWMLVQRVSFPELLSSDGCRCRFRLAAQNLEDAFPHFLPMVQMTFPSIDESPSCLLSDWHPESLIAHLCTDDGGTEIAMREHVQRVLIWLSEWMEDTGGSGVSSGNITRLLVSPFRPLEKRLSKKSGASSEERSYYSNEQNALFQPRSMLSSAGDKARAKLDRLLEVLGRPAAFQRDVKSTGKSREFKVAMSLQAASLDDGPALSPIFDSFSSADLRVLWAITHVARYCPDYGKLDEMGQFALTTFLLYDALKESPSDSSLRAPQSSAYSMRSMPSFFSRNKSSSTWQGNAKLPTQSASAGSVSALLSNCQGLLLGLIREPTKKLDWTTVRGLRMPFWVRSDEELRQLAEEAGQSLYRESRDILRAAIFFLAAGKKRTLRNLSAADSTESGKKFFKFLNSFDFSSERGRAAAEKNAFSLLRKNKYDSAAAFFLLAEPPILKSAVETIASKIEDLDLAFMVARLVGNSQANNQDQSGSKGAGLSFGSVIGGGGGYANMSYTEHKKDNDTFNQWKPGLNIWAKHLVVERLVPSASEDSALSALLLLWLGKQDEAWHWLSGFIECHDGVLPDFASDPSVRRLFDLSSVAKRSQDPTMIMVNGFINFASGPKLLKAMNAASRTQVASALLLSSALVRIGVELPALGSLRLVCGVQDELFKGSNNDSRSTLIATMGTGTATANSPAFGSDDQVRPVNPSVTQQTRQPPQAFETSTLTTERSAGREPEPQMESSIFDTFDPPPRPSSGIRGPSSSIFDAYDAHKPVASQGTELCDEMSSSIFDSFEVAPPNRKSSVTNEDAEQQPSAKRISNVGPSTMDQPTIFEECDVRDTSSPSERNSITATAFEPKESLEPLRSLPKLWGEWRNQLVLTCGARRAIREIASLGAPFHLDIFKPTMFSNGNFGSHIVPSRASRTLQFHAPGEEILNEVKKCLFFLSELCDVKTIVIVDEALRLLEAPYQFHRLCFAVLLFLGAEQIDLAEDAVRDAARSLIERCNSLSCTSDSIALGERSMSRLCSLYQRQAAAHLSWQLELCLWMHRGGALPLSGLALNETICAVRIGMVIASWNKDFEVLETMIRQPPDCCVNDIAGRQLWSSLKIISGSVIPEKKSGISSGGWEFLVDCRRVEATEMLHHRPTGSFIIRPHAEDHGVFTLSFKTNLKSKENPGLRSTEARNAEEEEVGNATKSSASKPAKRDDVVQHAVIRLSDSGFRCGSFGPFATLMKLLEAVSVSLPFKLRFDQPPTDGVIKDEGTKASPNAAFFRKLALAEGKRPMPDAWFPDQIENIGEKSGTAHTESPSGDGAGTVWKKGKQEGDTLRSRALGMFCELQVLSQVRKQLSSIASADYDDLILSQDSDADSVASAAGEDGKAGPEQEFAMASRILRPFLTWCRMMEIRAVYEIAPDVLDLLPPESLPVTLDTSENQIEISVSVDASVGLKGGDALIRRMIQPGSGVRFRTLRVGEGGDSAMIVLFSRDEAVEWLLKDGGGKSKVDADHCLEMMELHRVIEPVNLESLAPDSRTKKSKQGSSDDNIGLPSDYGTKGIRYRLVDPWEVEALNSREGETQGASLGRYRFLAFNLARVATSCEEIFRCLGGLHLLELWAAVGGGVSLTKAIATIHPPWERDSGGDLQLLRGSVAEPDPYDNSIRQHLYRNALFRRLGLPQRFIALIQVELLDLKNLTSPGGSLSLSVYSLLRLKRPRSTAPLTTKARTLDSAATQPIKLGKATGPNAPASWGSLVRFRFPLPEHTSSDGRSHDADREALFKGAPSVLQVSVYEKKFMTDALLGGADVKLDGLHSGGQLEEWVPLRTESDGINWFARIRLTLRFEMMCLLGEDTPSEGSDELAPSVGLRRIQQLSSMGGIQEDLRKSMSTPDLLSYFENMVY